MTTIYVGVDGSELAREALRWALEEAALRSAHLEVVHAVARPEVTALPAVLEVADHDQLVSHGEQVIAQQLAGVNPDGVTVTRFVGVGAPAAVITNRATKGDLIVVGSRGLGGLGGLLMGSSAQRVVAKAPCPVVVVVEDVAD